MHRTKDSEISVAFLFDAVNLDFTVRYCLVQWSALSKSNVDIMGEFGLRCRKYGKLAFRASSSESSNEVENPHARLITGSIKPNRLRFLRMQMSITGSTIVND